MTSGAPSGTPGAPPAPLLDTGVIATNAVAFAVAIACNTAVATAVQRAMPGGGALAAVLQAVAVVLLVVAIVVGANWIHLAHSRREALEAARRPGINGAQ
jgi:fructose-specific phosphotransferase system IIC component